MRLEVLLIQLATYGCGSSLTNPPVTYTPVGFTYVAGAKTR